jgi:riboflavin kinase / FMN adenylyltransferase
MQHHPSLDHLHLASAWVTIGSFDGVHLGHQFLINRMVAEARQAGSPLVVITFYPHPAVFFQKIEKPFYLTSPEERASLLGDLGVDHVVTLPFNQHLANRSARDFVNDLHQALHLRKMVVGYDFALGRGREGTLPVLRQFGEEMGFVVEEIKPIKSGSEVISSRLIRSLVSQGDVNQAAWLLGRPHFVSGTVVHGDGRGKGLGIPTANLKIWPEKLLPSNGVYATWIYVDGQRLSAVTNIGYRPTFENRVVEPRVEPYILDFNQNLYGKELKLEFVQHLRDEVRFDNVAELLKQIQIDILLTREVLQNATPTPGLPA